jgi:hypothetical protein
MIFADDDIRNFVSIQTKPTVTRETVVTELMTAISRTQVDRFEVFEPSSPGDQRIVIFEFVTKGEISHDLSASINDVIDRYHDFQAECDDHSFGLLWSFEEWCQKHVMDRVKGYWLKELPEQHLDLRKAIQALERECGQESPL